MAKFFKILGIIIALLLLVIIIGGFIFIKTFDFNKYKGMVTELASKELGRELVINGDASVGISLVPTIILEDVELANAPWAKAPQMVKIQKLEVKFAILPLLHKEIEIDNIILNRPEINLEVSAKGEQNWVFSLPAEDSKEREEIAKEVVKEKGIAPQKVDTANAALVGFAAKNVEIDNGVLNYVDNQNGSKINLQINSVEMSAEDMNSDINLSFDLLYNKQPIKGKMTAGSVNSLLENKAAFPLQLNASAYGVNAAVKGTLSNVMKAPSFDLKANIYNPAGNFNAPETTLITNVKGDLKKINAAIDSLNVVNNVITGTITADIGGKIPYVNANLQSNKINLLNFNQNSNMAWVLPSLIATAQASNLVPNDPIPFAVLKDVNADAKVKIGTLIIAEGMQADNVNLTAKLNNGSLNVNPLTLNIGGGQINANLQANVAAQSVALKLTSQNMKLQNLHKEFQVGGSSDFGVVSGGNIDLNIDLRGNGSTYRQLVNNLSGQAIAIVDKSVIQTGKLDFLTGNFVSQLMSALQFNPNKTGKLDLICAVARADLGGGKANFPQGIAISSKQLNLVSDGSINLTNDKIDFGIKPNWATNVKELNVASTLASFIKVKGTLESPRVAIDDASAAKAIIGVAATGGIGYLGSKVVTGDNSPCYTALKGTPFQNRFPAPSGVGAATSDVYQGAEKTIDNSIDGLKNTAKDILGIFKKKK